MHEFKFYKSYNPIIKRKARMLVLWSDWKRWKLPVKGSICMWGKNWALDPTACRKSMQKFGPEFNTSYVFSFLGGWEKSVLLKMQNETWGIIIKFQFLWHIYFSRSQSVPSDNGIFINSLVKFSHLSFRVKMIGTSE